MRILSVITAYPPSTGGAQVHAHELHRSLLARGHEVVVATAWRETRTDWALGTTVRAPGRRPPDVLDGVRVEHLGLAASRRLRAGAALAAYPAAMRTLAPALTAAYAPAARDVLDRVQPDVVHLSRVGREWLYQAVVRAARARGIPYVLTPNHHPHWTRPWHWWWWELYRHADAVLVLSEHEAEAIEAGGVDRERIVRTVVGPVGEPPEPTAADAPPDVPPAVAFLGQIRHYKGLDVLEAAMRLVRSELPGTRLAVVGPWLDAPGALRRRLEDDPLTTVHGSVDEATKWGVLRRSALLCVPSSGEALGGVYLEAWRVGRPAVGADIPPVRELFGRTGGGVVVDRDPAALAAVLVGLLRDPVRRDELGTAGRRALAEEYNWGTAASRAEDAYELARRP
ncbi:MAG: glycosyltransferase family 4 protein [Actinobacteria bacterium]|nr:glycosyltransferase family 4 protein [Actinomycetota bacterium]